MYYGPYVLYLSGKVYRPTPTLEVGRKVVSWIKGDKSAEMSASDGMKLYRIRF